MMINGNIDLNTVVLLIVAFMNAVTLYYTRQTEKNTNSLVGRLVTSTAEASDAAGHERARKEGELRAAQTAAGRTPPAPGVLPLPGKVPLPVADDRTAVAAERSATATERVADAAEEVSKKP